MAKKNLTIGRVNDFTHEGAGQSFLWDSSVSGLAVRATSGSKAFIFERRFNDKTTRLTIGKVSAWSLPEARKEARELARMMDRGIDPRVQRAAQRLSQTTDSALVSDLWEKYIEAHEEKWSKRHLEDNHWLARPPKEDDPLNVGVLWPLLNMSVSEINAQVLIRWGRDVTKAHKVKLKKVERERSKGKKTGSTIQGRNAALRQGFIRFRAFWRWAHGRPEDFGKLEDPIMFMHGDITKLIPKSKPKDDVIERGQLEVWFKAIRQIQNPVISAYLQVLLLTGARRNEISSLKWKDVNFQWKSMQIKDKVEEGRKVPLTPYIEFLFESLPRLNEWVFSSETSESGHITEPRIAHKRALVEAGLPSDLSLHGLRRSFASLSEWVEMPVGIVAQIMGHKPSATAEKHYKRRPLDLLAIWHGKLEEWILVEGKVDFDKSKVKKGLRVV